MNKTSRALRRHHRDRLKKRARKVYATRHWPNTEEHICWLINRTWNNMKLRQCYCCCNQRSNPWLSHKDKLTMQERRVYDDHEYQLTAFLLHEWLVTNEEIPSK